MLLQFNITYKRDGVDGFARYDSHKKNCTESHNTLHIANHCGEVLELAGRAVIGVGVPGLVINWVSVKNKTVSRSSSLTINYKEQYIIVSVINIWSKPSTPYRHPTTLPRSPISRLEPIQGGCHRHTSLQYF